MPFLLSHPTAAWLFPAIALPILFHLFFRLRRQVREFPSLMFFLRIDPRLSAKRKIHEWLILLLRTLFIALLITALTRPLVGLKSSVENVARLVLIDNSGSMSAATTGGISKLTLAGRATEKLIASSLPGDSVAVQLMIPDPTVALPPGFDAAPALLRDALGKITPSDGAAPIPKAIRAALATLETAKQPQRELHIITDLQQKNWSRGELDAQPLNDRIIVHRIETPSLNIGSVSLDPVEIPQRSIPAGRVTPVRVALENHGPVAAHVRLNTSDDSGKNFAKEIEVAPNTTVPEVLTFSFPNPGFHWGQIWLEGDAAPTANRAELGFFTTDVQKVVFIGNRDDFAAMPYAISPGGNPDLSGIDPVFTSAEQLSTSLATKPLAVILTWENWPQDGAQSQALQDYVRQGGTLILVPAPNAGVAISHPISPWLDANATALQTPKEAEPVILLQEGDALWRNLRDADGRPKLGLVRALHYRPVRVGTGCCSRWSEAGISVSVPRPTSTSRMSRSIRLTTGPISSCRTRNTAKARRPALRPWPSAFQVRSRTNRHPPPRQRHRQRRPQQRRRRERRRLERRRLERRRLERRSLPPRPVPQAPHRHRRRRPRSHSIAAVPPTRPMSPTKARATSRSPIGRSGRSRFPPCWTRLL